MVIKSRETTEQLNDIDTLVKWLASFGQSSNGGVNRLLYSNDWLKAQEALKTRMENDGLNTRYDGVGNLFGRLEGTDKNEKTILTGSHIDTVIDGGMFDGVYGIVASLLATNRLYKKYGAPKKPIEVVSLCEEEGSRFPITFWGSSNIIGKYKLDDGLNKKDTDGISILDAMETVGFDKNASTSNIRDDISSFIELHVEQGVVLEKTGNSLGIVTHIVGQRRFNIKVIGESNHAGTTPMSYRKDAMSISAQIISYIADKAKATDPDLVATVGKLNAKPNVPNVIAGEVLFTLDVRHYQDSVLDNFCNDISHYLKFISDEQEIDIHMDKWMSVEPVTMDAQLTETAKKIAKEKELSHQVLVSGAGHDAQVFGSFCPTVLLFVPSVNGISHSPKEFTKKEDLQTGVELLTALLYELAY
ncbi:allantoate deiminase [Aquibacillus rhizosphaerae]|uniref:Allantoate deiminase n=1 Tax=Aquibacillus rhizosphaerae TaxID=3051431 RepID=A0ABT7L573_9BACI|nr:allantoate deiminase [Aquibacillus sp. LR5S19]MDL4841017.1 allantoate deiminase [Aquibacillus sp. LR5S19]